MQNNIRPWYALAAVLVGAALVAINLHLVWSSSVDLAHHYALVFRLSENWHLVPNDPTLGEMNSYPRGSHMAAALIGKAVGSPFLGMHLVALCALVGLWMACLAILYAAPNHTGPGNAAVLAILTALNFGAFRIHGAEISNNYHFAQLVAQALVIAAIAVAIRFDAARLRLGLYVFLLAVIGIVTNVHLLPAVELLATLAALVAMDVLFEQAPSGARMRRALLGGAVLVAAVSVVVLNPSFAAMRTISNFNAGISLGPLAPVWSIAVCCVIALASIVSLVRAWRSDPAAYVMYKYLAAYGAAVAGLCLLQMVLSYFNIGSNYAAKKYAFGLTTFLLMRLALWLGDMASRRLGGRPRFARLVRHPAFGVVVFAVALFATVTGAARMRPGVETWNVVRLERQLAGLPTDARWPGNGKPALALDLAGVPPVIDYMFSLTAAHATREEAVAAFPGGERNKSQLSPSDYRAIISSPGNPRFGSIQQCGRSVSGLVLFDSACLSLEHAASSFAAVQPSK